MNCVILMPVLNDWKSATALLDMLDHAFAGTSDRIEALLVDDGSRDPLPDAFGKGPYANLAGVSVLDLRKNIGHQRAIAVGLCHLASAKPCDAVIVMDSDGEDEAADAVRLLDAVKAQTGPPAVVFAERGKRSESLTFRIGYLAYRILHAVLTGRGIRFGNFSAFPAQFLDTITAEPMLWNHYAASIVRGRLDYTLLPTRRGKRIEGKSRLNLVALIVHGLSALSCYSETVSVRLMILMSAPAAVAVVAIVTILSIKLFTTKASPGWASILIVALVIFVLQILTMTGTVMLQTIALRSSQPFLPARDYEWFVKRVIPLFKKAASPP